MSFVWPTKQLNILGEVWPSAEFVGKNARRRIVLESFTRSKIGESDSGLSKISIHMMADLRFALRQLLKLPGFIFVALIV